MSSRNLILHAALVVGLFLGANPGTLGAQKNGRISGTVTDAISGDPIADVTVSVHGSDLNIGTDVDGHFVLDSVLPGLVKLRAQMLGYVPITTDYYTVLPDSTIPVSFKLAPLAYEVDGVEVTGLNPEREWRREQSAHVLTKEDLPQQGNILNALQGVVPGIRVSGRHEDTRLSVRGAATDVLYVIDGQVMRPPLQLYIGASEVECVEVRRGYRAVMEYKPSIVGETYSGVVLIWTNGALGPKPRECMPRDR